MQYWWGADCREKLLDALKHFEGIVYLHNGGKFDIHHLLRVMKGKDLVNHRPKSTGGSRITVLPWRGLEFRDSFALIPRPLRSWAKDDIDYRKLTKHRREANKEEIIRYMVGDHKHLHELLAATFERYGQHLTLASMTFDIMEREFGIKIIRTDRAFDSQFRSHYFAGRVQYSALGLQQGDLRILDINSAFPRAMTERHWWSPDFATSYSAKQKIIGPGMYEVQVKEAGGALARRTDEGIEFPEGEGGYFFTTGWELLAGLKARKIKGLEICAGYIPKKLVDFSPYIRHFYDQKKNAKSKAEKYLAKLILNSFYGKLSQNSDNFREYRIRVLRHWPEGKDWQLVSDDKRLGISIFERPAPDFGERYCVATGASITGWVRGQLFGVIRGSKRFLYCDTDSVICGKPPKGLEVGEELGQWKEEMRCDAIWLGGKKLYAAHNRVYPWFKTEPRKKGEWIFVKGMGWTSADIHGDEKKDIPPAWKTAAKGVRLPLKDLIAVCLKKRRTARQLAPTYRLGKPTTFIVREVSRADDREAT